MPRNTRPDVLQLEDRCVPASFGNPWPDAPHLTLSFVPDGTRYGDQSSQLFKTLDAVMPREVWQREILRAFQTWTANANINVSLVADGGQDLGTAGPIQGDARFGDIRVSAMPLASDALAMATPFDLTAGTGAGDIRINTNYFTKGGPAFDLYTVMLQESGHVFGQDNSPNAASVMFQTYTGPRAGLGTGDAAGLQALYGTRTGDAFEGRSGNETTASATRLGLLKDASGSLAMSVNADLTTTQDRDTFVFTTPLSLGGLIVNLGTTDKSLLTAKLSVFDARGNLLKTITAVDPRDGDLTLKLDGLKALSTYFVRVEGASGNAFSVGAYELEVQYLPLVHSLFGTVLGPLTGALADVKQLLANNDLHTNDSIHSAVALQQLLARTDSSLDYAFKGSISDRRDVDFYRVAAPNKAGALTVMAWGTTAGRNGGLLTPMVRVYDAAGKPVKAEVLVNDGYTFTVQVPNATPGATYYVEVKALDPSGANAVGNYFLGVEHRDQPTELPVLSQGTLTAAKPKATTTMTVDMSGLHHFVLSGDAGGASNVALLMTIYDAAGNEVYNLGARAGLPASGNVYLKRGTYYVRILVGTRDGQPLPNVTNSLRSVRTSDNNGPEPMDPTGAPSGASTPSQRPANPGPSSGGSSGVGPQEPYDDPYTVEDQQDWFYYYDTSNHSYGEPSGSSTSSDDYYGYYYS